MGTEADFYSELGVANPSLVKALHALTKAPTNPVKLARFLDHYVGADLSLHAQGQAGRVTKMRSQALDILRDMQRLAIKFDALETDANADLLQLAMADLLASYALELDHGLATRAADAVRLIASIPLQGAKRGRPEADPVITNVARAVRAYCESEDIPFSGDPRPAHHRSGYAPLATSEAAILLEEVLRLLGIDVTPQELGTHFRKAREG